MTAAPVGIDQGENKLHVFGSTSELTIPYPRTAVRFS